MTQEQKYKLISHKMNYGSVVIEVEHKETKKRVVLSMTPDQVALLASEFAIR